MDKKKRYLSKFKNKKVLIHGLGTNGGGVGTALFFLKNGIPVTITDLKNETELASSIEILTPYSDMIRYVLGEHRETDFAEADFVVKGPGVPPDNKYIKTAISNKAEILSDIGIFLNMTDCRIVAVTGSKGKSTVVSALYAICKSYTANTFLGGNITISPLTFYDKVNKDSIVVLELSSWQLRDIKGLKFRFEGAVITNLLNDHQNYYKGLDDYLDDKKIIADGLEKNGFLLLPSDDPYLNINRIKTEAQVYYFNEYEIVSQNGKMPDFYNNKNGLSLYFNNGNKKEIFNCKNLKIAGNHAKKAALISSAAATLCGIDTDSIEKGLSGFEGVPFRLETVKICKGIRFINDTTATIPEAAANALTSFDTPVIWIGGGNDKRLNFEPLKDVADRPKAVLLLTGDGTSRMIDVLGRKPDMISDSLELLIKKAIEIAVEGDIIMLSPGCTSFGLFQNEFDRGRKFNAIVERLTSGNTR